MPLFEFDAREFIPLMVLTIPIIAVIGGITAGILKTMGRQRLIELAQRERIAAIERGLDPSKLPPLAGLEDDEESSWSRTPKQRAQGLLIGGIVTLFAGVAVSIFLSIMEDHGEAWAVGIIPAAVGLALLISAFLIWPRGEQ